MSELPRVVSQDGPRLTAQDCGATDPLALGHEPPGPQFSCQLVSVAARPSSLAHPPGPGLCTSTPGLPSFSSCCSPSISYFLFLPSSPCLLSPSFSLVASSFSKGKEKKDLLLSYPFPKRREQVRKCEGRCLCVCVCVCVHACSSRGENVYLCS